MSLEFSRVRCYVLIEIVFELIAEDCPKTRGIEVQRSGSRHGGQTRRYEAFATTCAMTNSPAIKVKFFSMTI